MTTIHPIRLREDVELGVVYQDLTPFGSGFSGMSDALLRFADELGAAGPAEVAAPVAELHLVTFTLDREAYGVPVQRVHRHHEHSETHANVP